MTATKLTDSLAHTLFDLLRHHERMDDAPTPHSFTSATDIFPARNNRDNAHRRNLKRLASLGLLGTDARLPGCYAVLPEAQVAYRAWHDAGGWQKTRGGIWNGE